MNNIVTVENISKSFNGRKILNNISISFEKGKIYGITGRNGSGKTVFLKTICGFLHPDNGYVSINGEVLGKDLDFPPSIGVIIESPGFLPHWSGYQNLRYLASLRDEISSQEIRNAINLVGLDPFDKKTVSKYSLGMKQRLGIAQAIMEDPQILILDEPMNGLDSEGVQHMRELLLLLRNQGKTIILASHVQADIVVLCDEVFRMEAGVLVGDTETRA